jgi:hypothetical protein
LGKIAGKEDRSQKKGHKRKIFFTTEDTEDHGGKSFFSHRFALIGTDLRTEMGKSREKEEDRSQKKGHKRKIFFTTEDTEDHGGKSFFSHRFALIGTDLRTEMGKSREKEEARSQKPE